MKTITKGNALLLLYDVLTKKLHIFQLLGLKTLQNVDATCKKGDSMHTKQTVKYLCEQYPSGNTYYYKQEIITHDCWDNIHSLQWSTPRPISKATFYKRQKEGFKVEIKFIDKSPARVFQFNKNYK